MSWTQSQRRVVAGLALWASLSSVSLPMVEAHPLAADDAACRGFGPNSHETLRIVAPADPGVRPEHCDVCHLQRALSGAFTAAGVSLTSPLPALRRSRLTDSHPVTAVAAALSSRGPPVVFHN